MWSETASSTHDVNGQEPVRATPRGALLGRVLVGAIAIIAVVLLVLQNRQRARVEWLWFDGNWPTWALIAVVFAGGVASTLLVEGVAKLARRR